MSMVSEGAVSSGAPMMEAAGGGYAPVEKNPALLTQYPPQLADYGQTCEQFSWEQVARDELRLPRFNGVNAATICIDDHPSDVMQRDALIWKSKQGEVKRYTFTDLKAETNRVANALQKLGVQPGDRVFLFLERVPELYIAVFGGLKLQAVVSPLFSAFGPDALLDRLADSEAKLLITSPNLKPRIDEIRSQLPKLETIVVLDTHEPVEKNTLKTDERLWTETVGVASPEFTVPHTDPETLSIMHYTSGTTGKPKGATHCHRAIVAQFKTAQYVLDINTQNEQDVYWCTADPGWVTGTSYGMLGPWANGKGVLVAEEGFSAEGWYHILQDFKVTIWYTAPTAIRMLMKAGDELPKRYDLSALRHLISVGEPLNPEAVVWGKEVLGHVFHDSWWQTETGAIHITNYPCMTVKPGSMGKPFPGTEANILDDAGNPVPVGEEGNLVIKPLAPSMFKTYWNKESMYQSRFKNGWYYTGDRARKDADGYYWFIGRADDVINTAGHMVGPFEVESALVEHPAVAEAGVIGKPDPERMEIIKAFVSLKVGYEPSEALEKEIRLFVRNRLAAHAYPREIAFIDSLPKTRSGKIMRRLLKARELGLPEGDVSTLED